MKKKNRQNFTISEKISDEFKKVCDHMSVNMSRLIENYMEEFIKLNSYDEKLKGILDNLNAIKIIAYNNYIKNEYGYVSLELSDYTDEAKIRKIITRIVHSSNIIAEQLKYGPANTCIINQKYYNMISKYLVSEKSGEFIGNMKIIKDNNIGDFILCIRLLSDDDLKIIDMYNSTMENNEYDISKQYAGFEVID
jgi:hypothetical protein